MRVLGNDHPNIATTLSNIGDIYLKRGKYEQALKKFEKCLEIQMKALGNDDLDITITLSNIGCIYLEIAMYD